MTHDAPTLRVVIADDERPARAFLASALRNLPDVELVGEASGGAEAVALIQQVRPDLALLDLQMPEVDGLAVVRLLPRQVTPLVAFVTAYDEYAVRAFDLNAIDYLLKPVEPIRLRRTLTRAHERLDAADALAGDIDRVRSAASTIDAGRAQPAEYLRRIPVRRRDDIVILPVDQVLSVIADGELLHLVTATGDRHTIAYRLKDLGARLDPVRFVRVSRSAIVNLDAVERVSPMPAGTYMVTLTNKQQIAVSRARARTLRDTLLRL
ncbi:MAG TPA: LytTR family DNA-binding domain-containing protein [Gemmatimonadaceae bacterium]|jgi:two-component system LytT family response regulator|nr:LytTR family DNA-binding domain-containing protein [Gemmatimonadaceae bacterium]